MHTALVEVVATTNAARQTVTRPSARIAIGGAQPSFSSRVSDMLVPNGFPSCVLWFGR